MSFEHSAGAVIFYREKETILFLLLQYFRDDKLWWDFPKGLIEKGETKERAMEREIREETGLTDIKAIPGFNTWIKFFFKKDGKGVFKIVDYFLVESKTKDVKISWEHKDFVWLDYDQAVEYLKFKNARQVLEKASKFINHEV